MNKKLPAENCARVSDDSPLIRELYDLPLGALASVTFKLADISNLDRNEPAVMHWIENETLAVSNHSRDLIGDDRLTGAPAMKSMALMGSVALNLAISVLASTREAIELCKLDKELNR